MEPKYNFYTVGTSIMLRTDLPCGDVQDQWIATTQVETPGKATSYETDRAATLCAMLNSHQPARKAMAEALQFEKDMPGSMDRTAFGGMLETALSRTKCEYRGLPQT